MKFPWTHYNLLLIDYRTISTETGKATLRTRPPFVSSKLKYDVESNIYELERPDNCCSANCTRRLVIYPPKEPVSREV